MYKQRFRYCYWVNNYYERKKQLRYIYKMIEKAQIKNYFANLQYFLLKYGIVYSITMLDLDYLIFNKMHYEIKCKFERNNDELAKIINQLDVYELFIIDENTKHIKISKNATILDLFNLFIKSFKFLNYKNFYIMINGKVIQLNQKNLLNENLSKLNINNFDNIFIQRRLYGGAKNKINRKRYKAGKYEADDSDVDSEMYDTPPPNKKRKHYSSNSYQSQQSANDENQTNLVESYDINNDDDMKWNDLDHNHNYTVIQSNEYNQTTSETDNSDNGITYFYNNTETVESDSTEIISSDNSELDNVELNDIVKLKHYNKENMKLQNKKLYMRNSRKQNEQFTKEQWKKKMIPPLTRKNFKFKFNDGLLQNIIEKKTQEHYCGKMNYVCPHCGAKLYKAEVGEGSNKWEICCKKGKIKLKQNLAPPLELKKLFTGSSELSKFFQHHIQRLNSAMALSCSTLKSKHYQGKFILSGRVYHSVPQVLLPDSEDVPVKAQIYTWDPEHELEYRLNPSYMESIRNDPRTRQLLKKLQDILHEHNWLVKLYKNIYSDYIENNIELKELHLKVHSNINDKTNLGHYKTFVKPSKNSKIATLLKLPDLSERKKSHLSFTVTTKKNDKNGMLNETHGLCDAFCFPLFYPYGETSYQAGLTNSNGDKITMTAYYRYKLFERYLGKSKNKKEWNPFIYGKRLFHLWVTNQWAKIQQEKLNFVLDHQKEFRAESYEIVKRARKKNKNLNQLGRKVNIIPKEYTESPRYYRTKYQNALAILRQFGSKPDLFITFTANTEWKEITEVLKENPTFNKDYRDDIIARVFHIKLKSLLNDLMKKDVLGMILFYIKKKTIEFKIHIYLFML